MSDVIFDFSDSSAALKDCSAPDLKALFDELNLSLFQGKISSDFPVFWCDKLRVTAGMCRTGIRKSERKCLGIRLSHKLFEKNGWNREEIRLTMIHEMAHAYLFEQHNYRGHGPDFQRLMNKLVGYKESHTYHTYDIRELRNKKRQVVEMFCERCGLIGERKRMPSRKNLHRYTHIGCGGKISFKKVLLASDSDTVIDFSN